MSPSAKQKPSAATVPNEAVTLALRAFEKFGGSLRYLEAQGWHVSDRIAMTKALEAATSAIAERVETENETLRTVRAALAKIVVIQSRELQRLSPAGHTPEDLDRAMVELRAAQHALTALALDKFVNMQPLDGSKNTDPA